MKSSDVKGMIVESIIATLNEDKTWDLDSAHANNQTSFVNRDATVNPADPKAQYANGQKWGVRDRLSGVKRELDKYPPAFTKGYLSIQHEPWWQKFKAKLTQLAADFGNSYGKR